MLHEVRAHPEKYWQHGGFAACDERGKVLSTDVLVVGGGIAGLTAAISIKETSPDTAVLLRLPQPRRPGLSYRKLMP